MKDRIECPYGEGEAVLKKEPQTLLYRKEKFEVIAHFYVCENCGEEFTTNEVDHITLIQAHNQYRERHNIPFPEEIKAIRKKYGLSLLKMSEVLRLGENGYANYEKGEIPTPAIGTLIRTAAKPANFLDFLSSNQKVESDKTLIKAKIAAETFLSSPKKLSYQLLDLFNDYHDPNNFSGYAVMDTEKIENLLIYFIQKCNNEFNDRLKLMKLLFFTDFCHYKNFGRSVSGLSYHKQQIGPVPVCYDHFFSYFEYQHVIYPKWEKIDHGGAREIVKTHKHTIKDDAFDDYEKLTLEWITESYKDTSTWDMVEKSNKIELKTSDELNKGLIGFQENAFSMA